MSATERERTELTVQMARGTVALAYLAELAEHVAEYDSAKKAADAIYAGKLNDAAYALASRIASTTHRANVALDEVSRAGDDDDDDDDD